MATLTLTKVWLNRVDTGEAISAQSSDRSNSYKKDGEVRTYSSGRLRSFTVEGLSGQFGVKLRNLSSANINTLKLWTGLLIQFRDHRGQLFNGTFYSLDVKEAPDPSIYDVSFIFYFVT